MNASAHDRDGVPFVKGHGTENDFVLLPDPDDRLRLSAATARALCDRHAGLGADGVIRVVRSADGEPDFEMDYRNADGSLAQMCGNGARLFARFLVDDGWAAPGTIGFRTRGGVRTAEVPERGDVTVGMGPATVGSPSVASVGDHVFFGSAVDVGNPHLVCLTEIDIDEVDLRDSPTFDRALFPDGVNIEFARPIGADHLAMRVYERGVGETRSCGTGTVAAAAAYLAAEGRREGVVRVDVPGGTVTVRISAADSTLTGPAVVIARGQIPLGLWARWNKAH